MLTTRVRLGPGRPVRTGSRAAYLPVVEIEGEPHIVRTDLIGGGEPPVVVPRGAALACLAQMTDLHVIDVQSPARFEFVNREWEDPRYRELLTMQRPQEALNPHAIEAMVQTINKIEVGPVTGSPLQAVVMTGDGIDNTQRNELRTYLALMNGGAVHPDSGTLGYEGVQSVAWPGDYCWKPDGRPEDDLFQSGFGFPSVPGLLERALEQFTATGLRLPWLGCYGNHEAVCQGVGLPTPGLTRVMAGSRKAYALPDDSDPDTAVETFVVSPERFTTGPAFHVSADPDRCPIDRHEFVEAHVAAGGHGFTEQNRERGTAYYARDAGDVRLITLETVCEAGGADGHLDSSQLMWLERRLIEVHSEYRSPDGSVIRTRNQDRIVVLMSHHGLDTMSNPRAESSAEDLVEILRRFKNVVLWLNGHIHANRVTPRFDREHGTAFWEVTTSSIVDWPSQSRLVELFDASE
ncbi:MAG TPA: TIGR03767 family metallophosphoesterase, partial [Patescibacteria group bacterium]|nr:TIGR03767 family metallophosphoesterase [Patescibacteria group bacterium]